MNAGEMYRGSAVIAAEEVNRSTDMIGCLEKRGFEVRVAREFDEILAYVEQFKVEILFVDHKFLECTERPTIDLLRQRNPSLGIIVLYGDDLSFDFLHAVELGISDWLSKSCTLNELTAKAERIRLNQRSLSELSARNQESDKINKEMESVMEALKEQLRGEHGLTFRSSVLARSDFPDIIGRSKEIERVLAHVSMVAGTTATVLITGESGTGKEMITRAIHSKSTRSGKPLVAINCAALSENLLESELFGHEKGAFTGAVSSKRGLIEEADGGTLFLDEISEMPLSFQVKLLRVLQDGEFRRVGGSQSRIADIRTIVATNKPLDPLVQKGSFREDLYHRINQFQIHIPSLRERIEDLSLLSQFFLESARKETQKPLLGFSPALVQKMYRYSWPGNIRELQSMITQAVIMATPPLVELKDMPMLIENLYKNPRKIRLSDMTFAEAKEEFEKRYFQSLIDRTEGNLSAASRMCRVERKHLRQKVRRLGIVGTAQSRTQKRLRA
ncbi:MAG: sigma-54-dependent Fis family transcriptional regulator [Desulfobacteraceae bacterium]|nr:MAG: sigma-54-dependent Fis family transcriptional regulator [Desulfobacteraceae bacterium]